MRAKGDRYEYCKMLIEAGATTSTLDAFFQTPIITHIKRPLRLDGSTVKVQYYVHGKLLIYFLSFLFDCLFACLPCIT